MVCCFNTTSARMSPSINKESDMMTLTFDSNTLYTMIREYYLDKFPSFCNYNRITRITNIYTDILTKFLNNNNCPAKAYIKESDFGLRDYYLEKSLDIISKIPPQEQDHILNYIDTELNNSLKKIMDDMTDMHQWLILEGYIGECRDGKNKVTLFMTTKFIDKEKLILSHT
jgi:hypothetical protein